MINGNTCELSYENEGICGAKFEDVVGGEIVVFNLMLKYSV